MASMPSDPYADTVQLPTPRLQGGMTLEAALKKRHSSREFLPDPLTLEQLSALLWAGFGVNRPGTWGRTAPSARNGQEVVLYAVLDRKAFARSGASAAAGGTVLATPAPHAAPAHSPEP